jgi:hypothetical protein
VAPVDAGPDFTAVNDAVPRPDGPGAMIGGEAGMTTMAAWTTFGSGAWSGRYGFARVAANSTSP